MPNSIAPHYCQMDRSRDLPPAVRAQLPAPTPARPVFAPLRNPGPTPPPHLPMLTRLDVDENGDTVPSTTSKVIPIQRKKLDPHTPIFSTFAAKTAFVRTLPSAIQLQLEQPFGKDNLNQCYYLQKCGHQVLHLLFISNFMTNFHQEEAGTCLSAGSSVSPAGKTLPRRRLSIHAGISARLAKANRALSPAAGNDNRLPSPLQPEPTSHGSLDRRPPC